MAKATPVQIQIQSKAIEVRMFDALHSISLGLKTNLALNCPSLFGLSEINEGIYLIANLAMRLKTSCNLLYLLSTQHQCMKLKW